MRGARIGPSEHRSIDRLSGPAGRRVAELGQAGVDRQLADRRLLAERGSGRVGSPAWASSGRARAAAGRCRRSWPTPGRPGRARRTPAGTRRRSRRGRMLERLARRLARTAPRGRRRGQGRRLGDARRRRGRRIGAGACARRRRPSINRRRVMQARQRAGRGRRADRPGAVEPQLVRLARSRSRWWRRSWRSRTSCWRRP